MAECAIHDEPFNSAANNCERVKRLSGELRAKSVSGPNKSATLFGCCWSTGSRRLAMPIEYSTMSPFFHSRDMRRKLPGCASVFQRWPLTETDVSAPAHSGTRKAIVNFCGLSAATRSVVSPMYGYFVRCSMEQSVPLRRNRSREGTKRLTKTPSGDWKYELMP